MAEEVVKYQWLKGDHFGTVETYKDIIVDDNIEYILFESGRRIALGMVGNYIGKMEGDKTLVDADLYVNNTPSGGTTQQRSNVVNQTQSPVNTGFTVKSLIEDQLKKNKQHITVTVSVPVLNKEHFNFLQDSQPDVLDDLVSIIVTKYINKEAIKESLMEKIQDFYAIKGVEPIDEILDVNAENIE